MLPKFRTPLGFFLVFFGWLGSLFLLGQLDFLKTKNIECRLTNEETCPDSLSAKTQTLGQKALFFGNFKKTFIEDQQLALAFKVIKIEKYLLDRVVIFFEPIKLSYLLKIGEKTYLVTDSAVVLDNQSQIASLPKVSLGQKSTDLYFSQAADLTTVRLKFHQEILAVIQALNQEQINFDQLVYFSPHQVSINTNQGIEAIINTQEAAVNASRLRIILNSKQLESLDLANFIIDVRFSLPVLRNKE